MKLLTVVDFHTLEAMFLPLQRKSRPLCHCFVNSGFPWIEWIERSTKYVLPRIQVCMYVCMYVRNVLASIKNLLTRKILTMVMWNVRLFPGLFFLCAFALFANFYSWFSSVLWQPLQVFTTDDTTVEDPGYAAGRVRGNWVEAWIHQGQDRLPHAVVCR